MICLVSSGCSDSAATAGSVRYQRSLWENVRPAAYRYQIGYAVSGPQDDESWWKSVLEITVVDNQAVQIRRLDTGEVSHDTDRNFPTVDGLFDMLDRAVAGSDPVQVRYDSTHGFPDLIDVGDIRVDAGYQYAVYEFAEIDPNAIELSPAPAKVGQQDFIPCAGLQRTWKQTRRFIEQERTKRQGLVCVWNINTGTLEMYGGGGDVGNEVEVSVGDSTLALFEPAGSGQSGFHLFDSQSGQLLRKTSWESDYSLTAGSRLSSEATRHVLIEADERVTIKNEQGFTSAFATSGAALRLIDGVSGNDIRKHSLNHELHFSAMIDFSPDATWIAVTGTAAEATQSSLAHDVVEVFQAADGTTINSHPGRFLTFTANSSEVVLVDAVSGPDSDANNQVTIGHRLVLWNFEADTERIVRLSASPHPSRFAAITPDGYLLADVSDNYRSVRLNLATIDLQAMKPVTSVTLPAVSSGDKWSISPDTSTFARLGRTLTSAPLIEVHDIASGHLRQTIDFSGVEPSGYPHVVGTATLIDADHLVTTHPEVMWNCPPGQ